MRPDRYAPLIRHLHWFVAGAVILAYAIGLIREELPRNAFRAFLLSAHMWIGQLVVLATLLRLWMRATTAGPGAAPGSPAVVLAARLGHLALYATLLAIPVLGLAAAFAKGRDVSFLGLFVLPSPMAVDKPFAETLEDVHSVAAHCMMLLAFGHAAMALAHHYMFKDGVMARMMPERRAPAE